MQHAIITKGRLLSPRSIILEEDIPCIEDSFEIIIINETTVKERSSREVGTLKGKIHIKDDFDEPLEDFREYME
ncbi:DUF2281 domain-containing protein [Pelodictyon phaeoclathratiforme]|jgi:hypothetical protein|uniref:DUF2281 domain-containing protein n=1 Tax=Pelodictyon phaeoclathratiforme (strain DSM 5477 / BU-1) TaxID=324925 RepID=B4S9X5_PELPB|nr:DUF2281 domain-containing protein [Pelodictyon phaeoclathratiforme]ACF43671.1 hypothetical protein Ppha_1409 [Pelodictyon phaeoclathratiforme BU-1]